VTAERICRISLERREPTGDSGYKRSFKRAHPAHSPGNDDIDVQRYIYLLKMPRQWQHAEELNQYIHRRASLPQSMIG